MTDYEHMIISAERYALGRMTYIVSLTVDYILKEIKAKLIIEDIIEEDK